MHMLSWVFNSYDLDDLQLVMAAENLEATPGD